MKIGVLVDQSAKDWALNWQERIVAIIQAASIVYEKQMNIELEISAFEDFVEDPDCTLYFPKGYGTMSSCKESWPNVDDPGCKVFYTKAEWLDRGGNKSELPSMIDEFEGMDKQLDLVNSNYRMEGSVVRHLFTGCDNDAGGYVGIATVGCLSGNCGAVNNIKVGWGTFAHELGHNFNGGHSFNETHHFGGIMDYGSNVINGSVQFNTNYRQCGMCSELTKLRTLTDRGGFEPANPGISVLPLADIQDYKDVPRGCSCSVQADTTSPPWDPAAIGCTQGKGYGWCNQYDWFASACPISCVVPAKFSCIQDPENSERLIAWWQTNGTHVFNVPQALMYTSAVGCQETKFMKKMEAKTGFAGEEFMVETSQLPFRCCYLDDSMEKVPKVVKSQCIHYRGTLSQAKNFCGSLIPKQQVCTAAQLKGGAACKTGCGGDSKRVWTSTAKE